MCHSLVVGDEKTAESRNEDFLQWKSLAFIQPPAKLHKRILDEFREITKLIKFTSRDKGRQETIDERERAMNFHFPPTFKKPRRKTAKESK